MNFYTVLCTGKDGTKYFAERDLSDMYLDTTVADILAGQVENVESVYAFDPVRRTSHDATTEIARACLAKLTAEPGPGLRNFIEAELGLFPTLAAA